MRIASIDDRASVHTDGKWFDIAAASNGRFEADMQSLFGNWAELRSWFDEQFTPDGLQPIAGKRKAPVPAPSQVFGVGLNYADHAAEAGMDLPKTPLIFPKFSSCIAGPDDILILDSDTVDWEVELVAVIGRKCHGVPADHAWDYVAGLTIGQDISDRTLQWSDASTPQFGLGKSKTGYGPIGPEIVTVDELADPESLSIDCAVNGQTVQHSNTRHLIFDVPALVSYLSRIVTLHPGDLIFTGTPSGVGMTRSPARYLADGDVLSSEIEGIGVLLTTARVVR
ncbi:fumarylacetoacetate hydrolase family protein [Mycobacterium intracellulare]|uniref:fumarylacetoacetate hydrolase family protein n=1 Tax=Mycobacterium intracellulare TaxID=1767 RepID=UPI001CDB1398|nr:fumarylacetoacetate hydrolase family protein [Mycobacterium intracellulare]MCA2256001.1 fumarylacetoacetate hydrolase family protein [Mycobacterium intracellulare]